MAQLPDKANNKLRWVYTDLRDHTYYYFRSSKELDDVIWNVMSQVIDVTEVKNTIDEALDGQH